MISLSRAVIGLFANKKGPWGGGDDGPADGGSSKGGPAKGSGKGGPGNNTPEDPTPIKGPWGSDAPGARNAPTPLDEWIRARRRGGGSGGGGGKGFPGFPGGGDKSIIGWAALGLVAVGLIFSSFHSLGANEQGIVMQFGRYSRTLTPGVSMTLPWPIETMSRVDVGSTRRMELGSNASEDLILTRDQSMIDIAYQVRWNIKNPENFLFQLTNPEETIKQVAESSMRAVIANIDLKGAMGNQRGEIEFRVMQEMQQTLDRYKAGVRIVGVSLRQADPPAAVNDAFKDVTAAQQDAQTYVNNANAYSLQLRQKAQGEATAFDRIYEQYSLAPGVTKRRMYYETMEKVLSNVEKTIVEAPNVTTYLPITELNKPRSGDAR